MHLNFLPHLRQWIRSWHPNAFQLIHFSHEPLLLELKFPMWKTCVLGPSSLSSKYPSDVYGGSSEEQGGYRSLLFATLSSSLCPLQIPSGGSDSILAQGFRIDSLMSTLPQNSETLVVAISQGECSSNLCTLMVLKIFYFIPSLLSDTLFTCLA